MEKAQPSGTLSVSFSLVSESNTVEKIAATIQRSGQNGRPATFAEVALALSVPASGSGPATSNALASFRACLSSSSFSAYFFEVAPTSEQAWGSAPFAAVLVDAPALRHIAADPHPFSGPMSGSKRLAPAVDDQDPFSPASVPTLLGQSNTFYQGVHVFYNLGGDALLISPEPGESDEPEPWKAHLAPFVQHAPASLFEALTRTVFTAYERVVKERGSKPTWLSTSGLGVYWLHIRVDSVPKYYTYKAFKKPPSAS